MSYWKKKKPNENVFVSFSALGCVFDLDRHVSLVSKPNATVTIFSSCDQISTLIEKKEAMGDGNTGKSPSQDNSSDSNYVILYIIIGIFSVITLSFLAAATGVLVNKKIKEKAKIVEDDNEYYGRTELNETFPYMVKLLL